MNIIFIGYRGTGKTTLSRSLGFILNIKRLESDQRIEEYFGLSIPEIINRWGWKKFRKAEEVILNGFSTLDNRILDLGGGAILHENSIDLLYNNSIVIYLTADVDTICKRTLISQDRPPLTKFDVRTEVETVLAKRNKLYKKYADIIIDTGRCGIDNAIKRIISFLQESYTLGSGVIAKAS